MTKLRIGGLVGLGVAAAGLAARGIRTLVQRRRPWYRRIGDVIPANGHRPRVARLIRR